MKSSEMKLQANRRWNHSSGKYSFQEIPSNDCPATNGSTTGLNLLTHDVHLPGRFQEQPLDVGVFGPAGQQLAIVLGGRRKAQRGQRPVVAEDVILGAAHLPLALVPGDDGIWARAAALAGHFVPLVGHDRARRINHSHRQWFHWREEGGVRSKISTRDFPGKMIGWLHRATKRFLFLRLCEF